jgi:hypothetical protein
MATAETVTWDNVRALVLGGLLYPCNTCAGVKEAFELFCRQAEGVELDVGNEDSEEQTKVVVSRHTPSFSALHCPDCHNTGWVPTEAGKALLWLVAKWLEKVTPEWKRGLDEIPF